MNSLLEEDKKRIASTGGGQFLPIKNILEKHRLLKPQLQS